MRSFFLLNVLHYSNNREADCKILAIAFAYHAGVIIDNTVYTTLYFCNLVYNI